MSSPRHAGTERGRARSPTWPRLPTAPGRSSCATRRSTDPADLDGVRRAIWAIELPAPPVGEPHLPVAILTGDRSTWPACQAAARRIRSRGADGLAAPSAALIAEDAVRLPDGGRLAPSITSARTDLRPLRCPPGPRWLVRLRRRTTAGRPATACAPPALTPGRAIEDGAVRCHRHPAVRGEPRPPSRMLHNLHYRKCSRSRPRAADGRAGVYCRWACAEQSPVVVAGGFGIDTNVYRARRAGRRRGHVRARRRCTGTGRLLQRPGLRRPWSADPSHRRAR